MNWKKYRARVSQMLKNRNAPSSVKNSGAARVSRLRIACMQAMHASAICATNIAVARCVYARLNRPFSKTACLTALLASCASASKISFRLNVPRPKVERFFRLSVLSS